jgi:hypothetical protein
MKKVLLNLLVFAILPTMANAERITWSEELGGFSDRLTVERMCIIPLDEKFAPQSFVRSRERRWPHIYPERGLSRMCVEALGLGQRQKKKRPRST